MHQVARRQPQEANLAQRRPSVVIRRVEREPLDDQLVDQSLILGLKLLSAELDLLEELAQLLDAITVALGELFSR